ncbi:MAG: lysophospholipid acyltransferase family protein [Henriciella sp.]|jgi:putative hemolysin|nr:lysophospholipid acyltransferase family protein [Henriciella sp.]MBO6695881.1 lysophospholipid acyltransferase family protein [Henriciella sp.]
MEEAPKLSYAEYFDHPLKRGVVRTIERLSGQPYLQRLYETYRESLTDEPFFAAAVKLLNLDVEFSSAHLAQIPETGPLVVVANHPFGVLDGLLISWLISLRRKDFKVLTNAVLDGAPEAREWLLPIDFAPTKEARATNIATRAECLERLGAGECIIVFPAGGVSTSPTPFYRAAVDDTWKPFTAKLITRSGAHVTPVFFEGQNSRLFQWASHVSIELRLALIFREVKRRVGTAIQVHIGETLTPETLASAGKRHELMSFLRDQTYGMAPSAQQRSIAKAQAKFDAAKPAIFH